MGLGAIVVALNSGLFNADAGTGYPIEINSDSVLLPEMGLQNDPVRGRRIRPSNQFGLSERHQTQIRWLESICEESRIVADAIHVR